MKLVPENIDEARITKSYETPLNKEEIKKMIEKMISKYQKTAVPIYNMTHWLQLNNFDSYQSNKWVRAIVETLFTNVGHYWSLKNTTIHFSTDELTDSVMNFWNKKLKKN